MDINKAKRDGCYIIKKFADRKLYDIQQSKLINLEKIMKLAHSSHTVKVFDHTGKDITCITLSETVSKKLRANENNDAILQKQLIKILRGTL